MVIAMIAFLRKAERPEALPFVHGGWVAALVAGAATWAVATYAIGISGASRELTEGFGSLLAAVILLSVGIWMHGKSRRPNGGATSSERCRAPCRAARPGSCSGSPSSSSIARCSRRSCSTRRCGPPTMARRSSPARSPVPSLLAVIAWAMLRFSRTLPIGQFFRYSAILIAILAVILAGKGIGALQEAGRSASPRSPARRASPMLGLFPTAEAIGAQLLTLAALVVGFRSAAAARSKAASPPNTRLASARRLA